jgi:hypothetical protein
MADQPATVPAPVVDGRRFDWFPRFDEASRRFAVAPDATGLPTRGRLWNPGRVLDQGAEGACCGFAAAADAAAEPVPVPRITNAYARGWYLSAKRRDEWPGEAYDGTSVLATLKEGRARGLFGRYGWYFSVEQLAHGLVRGEDEDGGPCVAGVEWRQGSYRTDELGILRPSGDVVGGHAVCFLGFVPFGAGADVELRDQLEELDLLDAMNQLVEEDEDGAFVVQNSWGLEFGRKGLCVVPLSVVRDWFATHGEFGQPQQRRLPPKVRRTSVVTESELDEGQDGTPEPGRRDETLHITAVELQDRDRILDPPEELQQESVTVRGAPVHVRGFGGRRVRITSTAGTFTLGAGIPVTVRRRTP